MQRAWLPSWLKDWCVLFLPWVVNGTTAYDASSSGNNGTLVNSPTPTRGGLYGYDGLKFNGSNQYVTVADANSLDFGTWDFSFSVSVRLNQLGIPMNFVSKMNEYYNGWTVATGFNFGVSDVWFAYSFAFSTWEGNASTSVLWTPENYYGYSAWKNARMSFVRRWSQLEIWLNGMLILNSSWIVRNVNTSYPLNVGRYNWSYEQYVGWVLSNLVAHNYALSPSKIRLDASTFFIP